MTYVTSYSSHFSMELVITKINLRHFLADYDATEEFVINLITKNKYR